MLLHIGTEFNRVANVYTCNVKIKKIL